MQDAAFRTRFRDINRIDNKILDLAEYADHVKSFTISTKKYTYKTQPELINILKAMNHDELLGFIQSFLPSTQDPWLSKSLPKNLKD